MASEFISETVSEFISEWHPKLCPNSYPKPCQNSYPNDIRNRVRIHIRMTSETVSEWHPKPCQNSYPNDIRNCVRIRIRMTSETVSEFVSEWRYSNASIHHIDHGGFWFVSFLFAFALALCPALGVSGTTEVTDPPARRLGGSRGFGRGSRGRLRPCRCRGCRARRRSLLSLLARHPLHIAVERAELAFESHGPFQLLTDFLVTPSLLQFAHDLGQILAHDLPVAPAPWGARRGLEDLDAGFGDGVRIVAQGFTFNAGSGGGTTLLCCESPPEFDPGRWATSGDAVFFPARHDGERSRACP